MWLSYLPQKFNWFYGNGGLYPEHFRVFLERRKLVNILYLHDCKASGLFPHSELPHSCWLLGVRVDGIKYNNLNGIEMIDVYF